MRSVARVVALLFHRGDQAGEAFESVQAHCDPEGRFHTLARVVVQDDGHPFFGVREGTQSQPALETLAEMVDSFRDRGVASNADVHGDVLFCDRAGGHGGFHDACHFRLGKAIDQPEGAGAESSRVRFPFFGTLMVEADGLKYRHVQFFEQHGVFGRGKQPPGHHVEDRRQFEGRGACALPEIGEPGIALFLRKCGVARALGTHAQGNHAVGFHGTHHLVDVVSVLFKYLAVVASDSHRQAVVFFVEPFACTGVVFAHVGKQFGRVRMIYAVGAHRPRGLVGDVRARAGRQKLDSLHVVFDGNLVQVSFETGLLLVGKRGECGRHVPA